MDRNTVILLYKAMVRPHLEYANSVWCPYKQNIENHSYRCSLVTAPIKKVSDSGRSPIYLNCVRQLIEVDRRFNLPAGDT